MFAIVPLTTLEKTANKSNVLHLLQATTGPLLFERLKNCSRPPEQRHHPVHPCHWKFHWNKRSSSSKAHMETSGSDTGTLSTEINLHEKTLSRRLQALLLQLPLPILQQRFNHNNEISLSRSLVRVNGNQLGTRSWRMPLPDNFSRTHSRCQ